MPILRFFGPDTLVPETQSSSSSGVEDDQNQDQNFQIRNTDQNFHITDNDENFQKTYTEQNFQITDQNVQISDQTFHIKNREENVHIKNRDDHFQVTTIDQNFQIKNPDQNPVYQSTVLDLARDEDQTDQYYNSDYFSNKMTVNIDTGKRDVNYSSQTHYKSTTTEYISHKGTETTFESRIPESTRLDTLPKSEPIGGTTFALIGHVQDTFTKIGSAFSLIRLFWQTTSKYKIL